MGPAVVHAHLVEVLDSIDYDPDLELEDDEMSPCVGLDRALGTEATDSMRCGPTPKMLQTQRSEEHTSELQSQ